MGSCWSAFWRLRIAGQLAVLPIFPVAASNSVLFLPGVVILSVLCVSLLLFSLVELVLGMSHLVSSPSGQLPVPSLVDLLQTSRPIWNCSDSSSRSECLRMFMSQYASD